MKTLWVTCLDVGKGCIEQLITGKDEEGGRKGESFPVVLSENNDLHTKRGSGWAPSKGGNVPQ